MTGKADKLTITSRSAKQGPRLSALPGASETSNVEGVSD